MAIHQTLGAGNRRLASMLSTAEGAPEMTTDCKKLTQYNLGMVSSISHKLQCCEERVESKN